MNIKKVAEMAGVSVATISRVINHPERVLPETRERVLQVMEEQEYTPNWFARGLNLAKTDTIALLVPNVEFGPYQGIIAGVETIAHKKENAVFLCNTRSNREEEYKYLKMVLSRQVDGIILVSSLLRQSQAGILTSSGVPAVHIGSQRCAGCETSCYIDQREGISRVVEHLAGLGHRQIDLLLDVAESPDLEVIAAGFGASLNYHGIEGTVHYGENGVRGGHLITKKLYTMDKLPEAFITYSEQQAFGVLQAAERLDIAVPGELAVASMTDSETCSIVSPPLTSLEQPAQRLGMVAARMLLDQIEEAELEIGGPQDVVLHPTLKIRRSCGNTKHIYELQE